MMNPEIKTQWVAALRSGEYKKGIGSLIKVAEPEETEGATPGTVAYCCLGVLTDLACKAGIDNIRINTEGGIPVVQFRDEEQPPDSDVWLEYDDGDLPGEVRRWAGLTSSNPSIDGIEAIRRNDGESRGDAHIPGQTFAEIADAIERDEDL